MKISTYGMDPGLTHGALVYSTFDLTEGKHTLIQAEVLFNWSKKNKPLGAKSEPNDIAKYVHSAILPKFNLPGVLVGIEFSPTSVYWRAQKIQIVSLAFMMGYLKRGLDSIGLPVTFITVPQLKKAFNIGHKETKEEYMSRPVWMLDSPELEYKTNFNPFDFGDDVFDAFLLSYLSAELSRRH